ncbi:MAG: glycosyltransferase family 9 protein [Planctomycetota bacterium]
MEDRLRILVVRLSALGDVLFTLPAVRALRSVYPEALIDWVVEDKAAALLEREPSVDGLIVYPRRALARALDSPAAFVAAVRALLAHARRLRRRTYHVILDFQGNLKSAAHLLLARGHRKLGFSRNHSRDASFLMLSEGVTPHPTAQHRIDKAMALATVLGAFPTPLLSPVCVGSAERSLARSTIDALPDSSGPLVVLHPGTSVFGAFKRWPPDRFGLVADHLVEAWRARVLVTWGPGEEPLARAAERAATHPLTVAPPLPSLAVLAAILEQAQLFVGSDSAPLHLAHFAGVPVVALFGPKDPAVYGPYAGNARVVQSLVPCSPCTRRRCSDALCMHEIAVDQVTRAADTLLEEHAALHRITPR